MFSYFIGIDIAKNTHWASCLSSDGEIVSEPFSFSNDNIIILGLLTQYRPQIFVGLILEKLRMIKLIQK